MSIFKAIFGICKTKKLDNKLWHLDGSKVKINLDKVPDLSQNDGAVYLKEGGLEDPVLVVRNSDNEFMALKNKCTHGGRKIDPVPGENKLKCCSIGHSIFDKKGNVISGSAEGPLTIYKVTKDGNSLEIEMAS